MVGHVILFLPIGARHVMGTSTPTIGSIEYGVKSREKPGISSSRAAAMAMEDEKEDGLRNASEEAARQFETLVGSDDVDSIKQLQHLILGRLQDSNAVLSHFNDYSEQCYTAVSGDLLKYTNLMKSMKKDLDYIFQKLRKTKAMILATYPDAFSDESALKAIDQRPDLEIPQ